MARKDVVVIGASSGGIDVIKTILRELPPDFPASVFIVVHTAPNSPAVLGSIFDGAGPLPAAFPENGEAIVHGRVYVARPDHHLVIEPGRVTLTRGPKENRFRPAVDPLFRSAAQVYGPRVIGVVLSGGLDDGTSGLWTVKRLGGTAIVQDPHDAFSPSMPQSALQYVRADHVVRATEIPPLLVHLAATAADIPEGGGEVPDEINIEVNIAREDNAREAGVMRLGEPSNYACPECHGVLLQLKDSSPLRFRCHTGHAYTLESLIAEMDETIEDSLWNAIRSLEERVMLMRHAAERHEPAAKGRFLADAEEAQRRADLVREAAMSDRPRAAKARR